LRQFPERIAGPDAHGFLCRGRGGTRSGLRFRRANRRNGRGRGGKNIWLPERGQNRRVHRRDANSCRSGQTNRSAKCWADFFTKVGMNIWLNDWVDVFTNIAMNAGVDFGTNCWANIFAIGCAHIFPVSRVHFFTNARRNFTAARSLAANFWRNGNGRERIAAAENI